MKEIKIKSKLMEKVDTYQYKVNDVFVTIIFLNGKFNSCKFPFVDSYTREEWKILAHIDRLISKIEKEKGNNVKQRNNKIK